MEILLFVLAAILAIVGVVRLVQRDLLWGLVCLGAALVIVLFTGAGSAV